LFPLIDVSLDLSQYFERPEENSLVLLQSGIEREELLTSDIQIATGFLERLGDKIRILGETDSYGLILTVWLIVSTLLLTRLLIQVLTLLFVRLRSQTVKKGNYLIVFNERFRNSFSFFKWIFIDKESYNEADSDQIIQHEIIHARQYHSADIILIELLATIMWFNPFAWMMRKSIRLVHEYLADEGALGTGIDSLRYQALLFNQAIEEKLICISSSFNHSLIKKRMIMITKGKFKQKAKAKIIALLPVSVFLFLVITCINGFLATPVKAAQSLTSSTVHETFLTDDHNFSESVIEDTIKVYKVSKKGSVDTVLVLTGDGDQNGFSYMESDSVTIVITENEKDNNVTVSTGFSDSGKAGVAIVTDGSGIHYVDGLKSDDLRSFRISTSDSVYTIETSYTSGENEIVIRSNATKESPDVVYLVDGKEVTNDELRKDLDAKEITKIDVIKSKDLVKKYTIKECDGVIIITTKTKTK